MGFLDMMKIYKCDPSYKIIKELIHYEIRMALPIKDPNSYNKDKLNNALEYCINRYLEYDSSLSVIILDKFIFVKN